MKYRVTASAAQSLRTPRRCGEKTIRRGLEKGNIEKEEREEQVEYKNEGLCDYLADFASAAVNQNLL
ncbi:MAG: hypothetical protein K2P88_02635 [Chitinophagaceae bacterium]|nr:hypothetical protein [Chitinophagaceae bacterium]